MSEKSTLPKRVDSTHEITFASVVVPKQYNAFQPCAIGGCSFQPKHNAPSVRIHVNTSVFCADPTQGQNLVGK